MGLRVHVPRKAALVRFLLHPVGKFFVVFFVAFCTLGLLTFSYYYLKFSRMIDEKLSGGPYPTTSMLFSAPKAVLVGDETTPEEIVGQLRRSGYGESKTNRMGWYHVRPGAVEIFPGPDSYFDQEAGVVKLEGDRVAEIISLRDNTERTEYLLEPELITNLFDRKREKRRIVKFPDIPKLLVHAVVSAEDKRFFQHAGFDPLRIVKSAYIDIREGRRSQGPRRSACSLRARCGWTRPRLGRGRSPRR